MYRYDGASWNQLGADIYGPSTGWGSRRSLALSGDGSTVALGAVLNDPDTSSSGYVSVYVAPFEIVGTCNGQTATISGSGDIVGTAGDDVIVGSTGSDVISGGEGADLICGGDGDDLVLPGGGNDTVYGNGATTPPADGEVDTLGYDDSPNGVVVDCVLRSPSPALAPCVGCMSRGSAAAPPRAPCD